GYVTSRYDIDGDMVQQAVEELRGELGQEEAGEPAAGAAAPVSAAPKSPASGWMQFALAGLVLLGIVAGGVWLGATLKEGGGLGRGNAMDKFLSQKPDPTKPIAMAEEETKEPDASDGSERTDGKDGKTQSRKKPKKEKGDAKDKGEIAETKASSKTGAIEAIGASLNASSNAGTSADAATTGTQSSAPRPTRTPIPPTPWQFDADHIVRVIDPAHASAASHITLIFTWGMEVDLSTFADAPQDQIIRYDLPAMMRQLDFMSFNTADLSQALLLDLPMMIRFNSTPENGLPPCGAVLKMQGDLFTLADPLRGLRNVTRKEIESSVREITIPYRDPKNLTGLVVGAAGDGVAELQKILARAGRNVPAFDGKFGAKLSDQLRTFQKQNKLPVTGNVDPMTAAFIATLREPGRPRLYS
ncbi:peptidoglycan-binding protein, partial [Candidatus Sumerlaeota bacterium]|nr:peptidoglycan-binding protein [Candidatus Sumerlaeota bacterium]